MKENMLFVGAKFVVMVQKIRSNIRCGSDMRKTLMQFGDGIMVRDCVL